jgi:hypothetical protein
LKENAKSKKEEQSKKRNEFVNKEFELKELSTRILLKSQKDENRDFIIDEIIKIKKTKREFLDVRERESKREFLDVRVSKEVKCEMLKLENENDEKKVFMMLINLFKYCMNLFV